MPTIRFLLLTVIPSGSVQVLEGLCPRRDVFDLDDFTIDFFRL